jgi:hypothetical protein
LAASLDYAITKVPFWISEMFGTLQNGQVAARRLFLITNPNQKRPGPVTISINEAALSASDIRIYLNGTEMADAASLFSILQQVEAPPPDVVSTPQSTWEEPLVPTNQDKLSP